MEHKHNSDSQISLSILMTPAHSNFSGKIHGGYILNLMDQVAFACASKHSGNYCVTASVNKVDFLQPIEVGKLVHLKASVNYTGNTSMVVGVRVESENIQTGEVLHCNSSYFTMVAKDDQNKSVPVPGLRLKTEEDVRRYVRSIKRKEHSDDRRAEFHPKIFEYEEYQEELEGHNVIFELNE